MFLCFLSDFFCISFLFWMAKVLFVVKQNGGFCHRPNLRSCFGDDVGLSKYTKKRKRERESFPKELVI